MPWLVVRSGFAAQGSLKFWYPKRYADGQVPIRRNGSMHIALPGLMSDDAGSASLFDVVRVSIAGTGHREQMVHPVPMRGRV